MDSIIQRFKMKLLLIKNKLSLLEQKLIRYELNQLFSLSIKSMTILLDIYVALYPNCEEISTLFSIRYRLRSS